MCASFSFRLVPGVVNKYLGQFVIDPAAPFEKVSEDLYPFKYGHVFVEHEGKLVLTAKRYSLTPEWAKEEKVKWATYNARMNRENIKNKRTEYIYEVPTWKSAFSRRHCLVPMSEFRESCHEGEGAGNIVSFSSLESELIFAAGIYEDWINKATGEILSTFAIITTDPDEFLLKVGHDRSPVFLQGESARRWLRMFKDGKEAYKFLEVHKINPKLRYEKIRSLKLSKKSLSLFDDPQEN